jgi:hypothetical protein
MKLAAVAIMIVCMAVLASEASAFLTALDYVNEFGGDRNVYARILALTDCAALEQEFDKAEAESKRRGRGSPSKKRFVGYMTAVANQLEALGCSDLGFKLSGSGNSHPKDESLRAYKKWIWELIQRLTSNKKAIELTEEEWIASWEECWRPRTGG